MLTVKVTFSNIMTQSHIIVINNQCTAYLYIVKLYMFGANARIMSIEKRIVL